MCSSFSQAAKMVIAACGAGNSSALTASAALSWHSSHRSCLHIVGLRSPGRRWLFLDCIGRDRSILRLCALAYLAQHQMRFPWLSVG